MRSPRSRADRRNALLGGGLAAVAAAAVLTFFVVRYASENPEEANLGPSVFQLDAGRLSDEIAENGPSLFKDPLRTEPGREVYVQHLGHDPATGWSAIGAYASRASLDCLLRWDRAGRRFVDPCTGATYPPDGEGLVTYPASVERGKVTVDLRPSARRPA